MTKIKFKQKVLLGLVGISALLAANVAKAEDSAPKGSLVYCEWASPNGFDIAQYTSNQDFDASMPIYNRLVEFKRGSTEVVPGLATSWDVSKDGLTWTFHLRKGVTFHTTPYFSPTRDFNADDVVATFDRMQNPNNAFRKAFSVSFPYFSAMGLDKNIKSIEKIDDYTVKFVLNNVDASFIQSVAIPAFAILSDEYMQKLMKSGTASDINQKPIGTGPFEFVRYQKDSVIRYKANPNYWDKDNGAKVANLIFSITKDNAVRIQKLRANECQVIFMEQSTDLPNLRKEKGIKVDDLPSFKVSYVFYNNMRKELSDPRVRKALDMAINKQAIIKDVYNNEASLVANPLPVTQWSYNKDIEVAPYDPEKAKKLLAEAGYANGFTTTLWFSSHSSAVSLMAQMIQADWKKVGVTVNLRSLEFGELIKRLQQGEGDMSISSWNGDNGDPDNWLSTQFSCNAIKDGGNHSRFCNKAFDDLINKAKVTQDHNERVKLYEQAQVVFNEQRPATTLASPTQSVPISDRVQNFKPTPFAVMQFNGVSLKD